MVALRHAHADVDGGDVWIGEDRFRSPVKCSFRSMRTLFKSSNVFLQRQNPEMLNFFSSNELSGAKDLKPSSREKRGY